MYELICFDFWLTLFTDTGQWRKRHEQRVDLVLDALTRDGHGPDRGDVSRLMHREWLRFDRVHLAERRTLCNRERVEWMAAKLGFPAPDGAAMVALAEALDQGLFVSPPCLVDGMADLIGKLVGKTRLAVISDTSFSSGTTLRRLMQQVRILDHFDVTTFSDEVGRAKPDFAVFERTAALAGVERSRSIHVGDREETDVVGAKGAGMQAVLFLGGRPEGPGGVPDETLADYVALSVRELEKILGVG